MFAALMTQRRFLPLFICQFCSALNDNFLKNALGMLILFGIGGEALHQAHPQATELITLSGVVFIAPFFFLSALGGEIADKFDKARVAERIKFFEIPVAAVAALGFYLHSIPILFLALAGFGIIGALFGPVKYGILPEKLSTGELPAGNALVEGATFLAILLGTIFGGVAVTQLKSPELVVGIILALAIVCWLSAKAIPAHGPAAPDLTITRNPLTSTFTLLGELKADSRLWVGGQITSWFWLVGFIALSLLPGLVKDRIGGSEGVVTLCLATFTIGIALGSMLAAKASHERPNLALVPVGGALMGIAALALAWLAYAVQQPTSAIDPWLMLTTRRGHGAARRIVSPCRCRWSLYRAFVRGCSILGRACETCPRDRRSQRSQCRLHDGCRRHRRRFAMGGSWLPPSLSRARSWLFPRRNTRAQGMG